MKKKLLIALFIAAFAITGAFAKDEDSTLMNTITVDLGPTTIGLGFNNLSMTGEEDPELGSLDTFGFGIAVQYERELNDYFSVGGRFAYLGISLGFSNTTEENVRVGYKMSLNSFSLEGHGRVYPSAGIFFLDGMLGYGYLGMDFLLRATDGVTTEKFSINVPRSYFKYGGKLGWRFVFGNPGGFTLETSFGWYGAVGIGDTIGRKLAKRVNNDAEFTEEVEESIANMDDAFGVLEKFFFIGGPRLTFALGWTF